MIKAIIFDWGGVISERTDFRDFAEEFSQRHGKNSTHLQEIIFQHWKLAKTGIISSSDFWTAVARDADVSREAIKHELTQFFGVNTKVIMLIKQLKKKYTIGMLTNNMEDWLNEALREEGTRQLFDIILSSHSSGLAKPDPLFYHELLEKLKIPAKECVFIDDKESNLHPAQQLGMKTIHFHNSEQLIQMLKELHVAW